MPFSAQSKGTPLAQRKEGRSGGGILSIESIIGSLAESPAGEDKKSEEEEESSQKEEQQPQKCQFRLCTVRAECVGPCPLSPSQSSSPSSSSSSTRLAPFRALLFDGQSNLSPGIHIQIPANLRRFCHKTVNAAEANVCARTGKVLRKVAKGEELVMLVDTGGGKKRPKVTFGLTAEEQAQITESECQGDSAGGFACHRCGKVFSYEYYRDKHMKFTPCVDNGQRRFPCSRCPRSFEKRDRLRIHILHVHENHRPHVCQQCGKAFSQSSSLNKHLRTHSGERPYQCPHCEKAFTASSILRTHIRQHSGEKPFKCAKCGKCFASHAAHDSHIRRTHR